MRLRGHTDVVISCDVSVDGSWIATGGPVLKGRLKNRTYKTQQGGCTKCRSKLIKMIKEN